LQAISSLVSRIRADRGLTQEGLARELGVSFATVNGWENGKHRPIPALARRLEELAGVPQVATRTTGSTSEPRDVSTLLARSGWPVEPRERRDFYHRVREFPPQVASWRTELIARAVSEEKLFPVSVAVARHATQSAVGRKAGRQAAVESVRALVDDGISYIRELARLLAVLHGTPHLGNKADPADELVYIILARKTREEAYQGAFSALKDRFRTWDALLCARRTTVERLLASSGLGEKKTRSLFGALARIRDEFGSCSLEGAKSWPDERLESFLCELPEVSRKSAYCIMLYSFGRSVFPVDTHVGRVLSRLGPYRELGLDLEGLDHKHLQAVLADLIPPNLRYSLHVNLVVHGREVCRSQKPLCGQCDLKAFCRRRRREEVARVQSLELPRMVDLFAGAGGLSEGFQRAGFRVDLALDSDPVACRTYRLNHPAVPDDNVLCRDVRQVDVRELRRLLGRQRLDVLAGAPPCQGFSHVGQRSKRSKNGYSVLTDPRNFLYEELIRFALDLKPRLVLMENVPGMKSAKNGKLSFIDEAAAALGAGGYRTTIWRMNAACFGVPQERVRFFLVAAKGLPLPQMPKGEYADTQVRASEAYALDPVCFDDATVDLPERGPDDGTAIGLWPPERARYPWRKLDWLPKFGLLSQSRILYNHTVRYHNDRDLELYSLLGPGEDSVHILENHGRDDLMRYRRDVFDDKYARIDGAHPCKTIVAHLAKDGNGYVHPTQARSISFREAARVQTFRDDYAFCGSPSDQWTHLGNAVPPVMAEAIARSLAAALERKR